MADMDREQRETTKLVDEGVSLAERGRLDEAIELFTRAIGADPNNRRAYLGRADAHRRQANEAQAFQDEISSNMLAAGGRFGSHRTGSPTAGPPPPLVEAPAEEGPSSNQAEAADAPEAEPAAESQVVAQPAIDDVQSRISPLPSDADVVIDQTGLHPYGGWLLNRWGLRQGLVHWTVERLLRSLLIMAILAVAGSVIAKVSFCSENVGGAFWTGCGVEMLAFTLGGATLGALISFSVTWGLRR